MTRLPGNEGGLSGLWRFAREKITGKPSPVVVLHYSTEHPIGSGNPPVESVDVFAKIMSRLLTANECEAEFFREPHQSLDGVGNKVEADTYDIRLRPKNKMKKDDFIKSLERILRSEEYPESERVYQFHANYMSTHRVSGLDVLLMHADLTTGLKQQVEGLKKG